MSSSSQSPNTTPTTPNTITAGLSYSRIYRPYLTKRQLAVLSGFKHESDNSSKMSSCKFIQRVGRKLGFPQLTTSMAQSLFHRFYLYYSTKDYATHDISITSLFVASKARETIKRLQDIFVAVHSVKHPNSKELDPEQVSEDRCRRIISYEKLMLEANCYNFLFHDPYEYVIKYAKFIQEKHSVDGKALGRKAYEIAVDSFRIPLCVEYPAHTIAGGCIYLAAQLLREQDKSYSCLASQGQWVRLFCSRVEDIEDVCQRILDMYIYCNEYDEPEKFTRLKIEINDHAQQRQTDSLLDDITANEMKTSSGYWKFEGNSTLDIVNTSQHTVSYIVP